MEQRNQAIKHSHDDLARRAGRGTSNLDDSEAVYYSAWFWSAIHILVSIKEFGTVAAIARRLRLPAALVELVLGYLAKKGFVGRDLARWTFAAKDSHLPRTSPFIGSHHANWRQQAVLSAQDPTCDDIHFTVVQSVSRRDQARLRQQVTEFVAQFSAIAGPSAEEEELVCFNCDFFVSAGGSLP